MDSAGGNSRLELPHSVDNSESGCNHELLQDALIDSEEQVCKEELHNVTLLSETDVKCTTAIEGTHQDFISKRNIQLQDSTGMELGVDVGSTILVDEDVDHSFFFISGNDLNVTVIENSGKVGIGDGSDSGVELNGGRELSPALQRALSCNSGGYASSCGGLEDAVTTPALSCDSSLISCYSTYEDTEDLVTSTTVMLPASGDGTSEGGSESSSVTGHDYTCKHQTKSAGVDHARLKSGSSPAVPTGNSRPRPGGSARHQTIKTVLGTPAKSPAASNRREKGTTAGVTKPHYLRTTQSPNVKPSSKLSPIGPIRGRSKAIIDGANDGLKKECAVPGTLKGTGNPRSSSSIRNKVIGSSLNDDGRWPSLSNKSTISSRGRGVSVPDGPQKKASASVGASVVDGPQKKASVMVGASVSVESKASALEKYATLPRRRRHKSPETPTSEGPPRSHSVSRDLSLNRAASLRKQHHMNKTLPPYPHRRKRVQIYHEISVQTALTGSDVQNALAGIGIKDCCSVDKREQHDEAVQVDCQQKELEILEQKLQALTESHIQLQADCAKSKHDQSHIEQQLAVEKLENLAAKEKLTGMEQKLLGMLLTTKGQHADVRDDLNLIDRFEMHLQSFDNLAIKKQHEVSNLQTLCRTLQRDLEKSLAAQETLLEQQKVTEGESIELQDFLHAEKAMMADYLRDVEIELEQQKLLVLQRTSELEQQQEECKHLVRISEQRRQENLSLLARLSSLEQRSKDLLLQQGAAVSGAAVALSSLSSRLDGLVEQLVISYSISEKDLEDVIFHNEAYSKSNSSVEASPERTPSSRTEEVEQRTPSPKRGASFVSAVIAAIRNAASQSPFSTSQGKPTEIPHRSIDVTTPPSLSDSTPETDDLLESEKEPSIVLDDDSSKTGLANSESLQNLSQAILTRQQFELAQTDSSDVSSNRCDSLDTALLDYSPALTLVDQVIDVDNLVTRLLKVLRIIQLENDTCMDELHDERVQLAEQVRREQEGGREARETVRSWEQMGSQLQVEVNEAREQLHGRVHDLEMAKLELHKYREQVECLNGDVGKLTLAYQEAEIQLQNRERLSENVLKEWQESGQLPPPKALARILMERDERNALKLKLAEKEQQLKDMGLKYSASQQFLHGNWHQAATEMRRQYEAIDNALETLHSIQGVVVQCAPLAKLQQDLEDSNFQSASSLPIVAADLNANAALVTPNGIHNEGTESLDDPHTTANSVNGRA